MKKWGSRLHLPHPPPWLQACGAYLVGQLTHIPTTALFFSLSLFSLSIQKKGSKGRHGGWFLWNMLTQANYKEGKRGETYKETKSRGESKKSCGGNTVAACGSSFPLESGKSRRTPLTWSLRSHMISRPRYADVYGSSLLPGLWKNWREEKKVLFFQTCCIKLTRVSQHAKCVFHIKCNTDDCLVQLISWIRQSGGPLALEHFLYLFYISAGPVRNKIKHDALFFIKAVQHYIKTKSPPWTDIWLQ